MSVLVAHLSPEQIRLAGWYFHDGYDQHDIAEMLSISQQAVAQRIGTILRTLDRLNIPHPRRAVHPTKVRRVTNIILN